jgi:hypothetical protein
MSKVIDFSKEGIIGSYTVIPTSNGSLKLKVFKNYYEATMFEIDT